MAHAPMSVTLTLDDEIDISRGDMLTSGGADQSASGSRPTSSGWTSGRSIPAASYLLKHTTRTVTAEVDHGLVLNQIGTVTRHDGAAARVRPLRARTAATGSFILIDPATNFTAGAGMISDVWRSAAALRTPQRRRPSRPRRAQAASDAEAVEAVRRALEEILT